MVDVRNGIPPPVPPFEPGPRTARGSNAILGVAIGLAIVGILATAGMLVWLIAEGRV